MLILLFMALLVGMAPVSVSAASSAPIQFTRFASSATFEGGTFDSTQLDASRVVLAAGALSGTWLSPTVQPQSSFIRLIASWNADTPADSHLRVETRAATTTGESSDWYTLGIWAADDRAFRRTSVNGQSDPLGQVDTDTLNAQNAPFVSYALRVTLERSSSDDASPGLRMIGASVSDFVYSSAAPTSPPLARSPIELPVPPLSQEIHARQYPQWGGGGEAWCSPTSTEMVVEFWGRGPTADDLAWVDSSYADPSVDFAARAVYDAAYHGTGNWPFNAAYAAGYGLDAFITQLRSLAEAEQFVRAGIPVIASIASSPGELKGFLFSSGTNGHLVVIVGFDTSGNPIVNDPAAWSDATVRRVYDRAQFERVWLRGSSGTVYIIRPPEVPLPTPPPDATPNW